MNTDFDQDLLAQTLEETLAGTPAAGGGETSRGHGISLADVSATAEPFRMRCPDCKKLYSVELSRLSADDLTRFECVNCKTAFFAMRPELNGVHFLETHELETQFAPLASSLPTIDGFTEGSGVDSTVETLVEPSFELERVVRSAVVPVLEKAFDRDHEARVAHDLELSESADLVMMWRALSEDYQSLAKHDEFLAACIRDARLTFAAHKYAQILAVAPDEAIARLMRARVRGLATYGFDAMDKGMGWQTRKFPLPSFNNFIILCGTILVAVGLGFPNMKQTAGLGLAMIALSIGLRVFLRRPRA